MEEALLQLVGNVHLPPEALQVLLDDFLDLLPEPSAGVGRRRRREWVLSREYSQPFADRDVLVSVWSNAMINAKDLQTTVFLFRETGMEFDLDIQLSEPFGGQETISLLHLVLVNTRRAATGKDVRYLLECGADPNEIHPVGQSHSHWIDLYFARAR